MQEPLITGESKEAKVHHGTKVLRALGTESAGGGALDPNTREDEALSASRNQAAIGSKSAPDRVQISGQKYGNTSDDNQKQRAANLQAKNAFHDTKKTVKRSVATTFTASRSGESQSREMFVESVRAFSNYRPEYRRNGEDAKGSNPRQSEPHLDTSTFALSGDSAHNQAMVHWSGHNSSVSFTSTRQGFQADT